MIALGTLLVAIGDAIAGPYLVANGRDTGNAFKFDLATGAAEEFAVYHPGDNPRHLAMNDRGDVFAALNGGNLNVVKLVPQAGSDVLASQNFTPNIGNFGPGQVQFYNGDLYVAGNRSRVIFQYNGQTGAQVRTFSGSTSFNIVGMTIGGNSLYYSEIFQDRVWRFDLTQTPPSGGVLISDSTNLNEPWNMTIGHDGNLVIVNRNSTLVQRFDSQTGAFLGTLADVDDFNPSHTFIWDVIYSARLDNYFASAGSSIYRLDASGNLLQTYQSPLLQAASGLLVVVPEPSTLWMCALTMFGMPYHRNRSIAAVTCEVH